MTVIPQSPDPPGDHGVGEDYPVHDINWNNCRAFILRLNEMVKGIFRLIEIY